MVYEVSGQKVVVAAVSYDGEHSKLREGDGRPTTQLQLAKQCKAKAHDIASRAREKHKGAGSKVKHKRDIVRHILSILIPDRHLRRPQETGVLSIRKKPATPQNLESTAVSH